MQINSTENHDTDNNMVVNYAGVDYSIRLPESEFDVMMAIWNGDPPMNTGYLMKVLGNARGWKAPTLISFLVRLENRGFITSCKKGKERYYTPVANRELYLTKVTEHFVEKYHDGSFVNVLDALYHDRKFSNEEVDALLAWLQVKYR